MRKTFFRVIFRYGCLDQWIELPPEGAALFLPSPLRFWQEIPMSRSDPSHGCAQSERFLKPLNLRAIGRVFLRRFLR